jgi:hypothetical protein
MLPTVNFIQRRVAMKMDRSVAKHVKYLSNGQDYDVHAVIHLSEQDQDQKNIG